MTDTQPSPRLGLRGSWTVLRASVSQVGDKNITLIAAGVAFYGMLSLFPALAALIAVMGLISDPEVVLAQMEEMKVFLPGDVYDIIEGQVVSLVSTSSNRLGWAGLISLGLALWSARAGVGAMISGLSSAYQEPAWSSLRHQFRALWLTVALIAVGLTALLSLVVIPLILAFFPLGIIGTLVIDGLRWAVTVVVLFAGIGLLYRFGPQREGARLEFITAGAVIAVFLFVLLSVAFSYYVANFGNYNQVYGSIGAVIAMLTWLWISSFIVLFGAVLNAQVARERERRSVSPTLAQKDGQLDQAPSVSVDEKNIA